MTDYRSEYDRWLENTAEDAELHEELINAYDFRELEKEL